MPKLNHIHWYAKYKGMPGHFRCVHPRCTHFAPAELVVGKMSCCTNCGEEFTLDRESARRVMPRCIKCSNTKKARDFAAASALMQDLFKLEEVPNEE